MGYRFRKSIKILPGIRFNLSKSGVSATVGKPGASVNISERGTRGTVGLPGSGISYSEKLTNPAPAPNQTPNARAWHGWQCWQSAGTCCAGVCRVGSAALMPCG
jgi:hypothetical protein